MLVLLLYPQTFPLTNKTYKYVILATKPLWWYHNRVIATKTRFNSGKKRYFLALLATLLVSWGFVSATIYAQVPEQVISCSGGTYRVPVTQGTDCSRVTPAQRIGPPNPAANPGTGTGSTGGATSGAPSTQDDLKSCYQSGFSLGWVLCPFINLVDSGLGQLKDLIKGSLEIKGSEITDNKGDFGGAYKAWQNFARLSLIMLVVGTLIMVISQAISVGPFDAYTIKKMLPRLVIASVAIPLSWFFLTFLIRVSNALGAGVESLMKESFSIGSSGRITDVINFGGADGGTTVTFLSLVAGGLLGLIALIPLALGAAIGFILGFAVLAFRKVIVIALLIVSPIAIAAWAVPGLQKWTDKWWDLYIRALAMYPIIMLFISTGAVISSLFLGTGSGTGASGSANRILAIIAYFGPYFLIPLTFKFAGG